MEKELAIFSAKGDNHNPRFCIPTITPATTSAVPLAVLIALPDRTVQVYHDPAASTGT